MQLTNISAISPRRFHSGHFGFNIRTEMEALIKNEVETKGQIRKPEKSCGKKEEGPKITESALACPVSDFAAKLKWLEQDGFQNLHHQRPRNQ